MSYWSDQMQTNDASRYWGNYSPADWSRGIETPTNAPSLASAYPGTGVAGVNPVAELGKAKINTPAPFGANTGQTPPMTAPSQYKPVTDYSNSKQPTTNGVSNSGTSYLAKSTSGGGSYAKQIAEAYLNSIGGGGRGYGFGLNL